jgi:hypothetical protein
MGSILEMGVNGTEKQGFLGQSNRCVEASGFGFRLVQQKRLCSAARAKRAVRGGCGPVSGEFGDLSSPALFCFG